MSLQCERRISEQHTVTDFHPKMGNYRSGLIKLYWGQMLNEKCCRKSASFVVLFPCFLFVGL